VTGCFGKGSVSLMAVCSGCQTTGKLLTCGIRVEQTRDVFLNTTGQGVKGQEPSVEFKMKKVCDVEPKLCGHDDEKSIPSTSWGRDTYVSSLSSSLTNEG
jgi:hypothetical protein